MLKQLKTNPILFSVIAFLLPFIFYLSVFFGQSFGLECAAGVMGFNPPYQQTFPEPNEWCDRWGDVGAYAWQHIPQGIKIGMEYADFKFPIWNQNNGIGVPLAANFISTAYFIPFIPFIFFKSILAFDLFIIFRMSIASLGMYLFLKSLKIPKILSLLGSLFIFLNGYMTNLPSISHQSVDIMLPWIALLIVKSFETNKLKYFALLGMVTGLSHMGGNPESSLFVILFYICFSSFLLIFKAKERFKPTIAFLTVLLISFMFSSLAIIPGIEYIYLSKSSHEIGLIQIYSVPLINSIFFIYPYLLGLLQNNYYKEVLTWITPNYIGSFFIIFLIYPVFLLLLIKTKIKRYLNWDYYLFFILLLIILSIQYFGILQIPIFTKLPGFSQTTFPKYSLGIINLLIATIVPFSIYYHHKLINGSRTLIQKVHSSLPLIMTYVLFITIALSIYKSFTYVAIQRQSLSSFKLQILLSVVIVSLVFILSFIKRARFKYVLLFILASAELFIFLYVPNLKGDSQRRDTLRKPSAINFLHERDYKDTRIFSPDHILYPDYSSAFDLNDIRNLDALWPKIYYDYLKEFVVPDLDQRMFRFGGLSDSGSSKEALYTNNPFYDILSIKYVLSYTDVNAFEEMDKIRPFLNQFTKSAALRSDIFNIDGISRPVLFEHAPGRVELDVKKPKDAKYFILYPALSEQVFNKKESDGVRFTAIASANGKVFYERSITINPNIKEDQKWFEITIPIRNIMSEFELDLTTEGLNNNSHDWSGWGGLLWDTEINQPKIYQYRKIYDAEMKIYENTHFVPRLHPISEVRCVKSESDILKSMKANVNQITNLGIVFDQNCKNEKYSSATTKISNQFFDDQKVSFVYTSDQPSYIILSNLYYPGWKLKVDGKEIPIERVNYTFQGLRLPKSDKAKVEVIYDPVSFKIGLATSLLSLIFIIFGLVKFGNKKIGEAQD